MAASRVAELQLATYRKSPQTFRLVYPLLAVFWVAIFALSLRDAAPRVAFYGTQATLWVGLSAWIRLNWRRLDHQLAALAGLPDTDRIEPPPDVSNRL